MQNQIRFVIGQLNFLVGDIQGNLRKMLEAADQAKTQYQANLIIFPELALTGYPPEDLLYRADFHEEIQNALTFLKENIQGIDVLFGYPEKTAEGLYNSALFIVNNQIIANYRKQCLPNYGVFDEKRYFNTGTESLVVNYKGIKIAPIICEDIWFPTPLENAAKKNAELIIAINASPFDVFKLREREKIIRARIQECHVPIIYAHMIGGQDELIFDGRSIVMNEQGEMTHLAPLCKESLLQVDIQIKEKIAIIPGEINPKQSDEARTYNSLVLATHDYIEKNHFSGVIIGSSGGIDSALTLTIAVDAIGKERVHAVIMPSRYTAEISIIDAKELAKNLGIKCSIISIDHIFQTFLDELKTEFGNSLPGTAEENLQARCRAVILMALANKFEQIVLTTGNKSEMGVGYATLYGDMAGGFAPLKDVYKTLVYKLADYRNQIKADIPQRIIERPPSAELRFDQTDQDSLPPYPILDEILKRYVEQDLSIEEITQAGFAKQIVQQVIQLVDKNEYKRRQAPPGPKITTRAFGRDRRYPITSGFGKK